MNKKIFLSESEKKAIIIEREKAIINSFEKIFNKIKRIDENQILIEGKLNNLLAGITAASCVGVGCQKQTTGVEFDTKTHYTVTNTQTGEVKHSYKTSQGYSFGEKPTPEQLAILTAFQNIQNEKRLSNQRDKVDFLLSTLEIKEVPSHLVQVVKSKNITNDEFYSRAFNYLKDNPSLFQKELDEIKISGKQPYWLGQTLNNFDAISILNNPTNQTN